MSTKSVNQVPLVDILKLLEYEDKWVRIPHTVKGENRKRAKASLSALGSKYQSAYKGFEFPDYDRGDIISLVERELLGGEKMSLEAPLKSLDEAPGEILIIPLADIYPSPYQPRTIFEAIEELAADIQTTGGLIHPITLRKTQKGYELIAGERRFRAYKFLHREGIPAYVVEVSDTQAQNMVLLENLSREDLSPIEEARMYDGLTKTGKSIKEISARTGRPESTIYRRLKLTTLIPKAAELLDQGLLPVAHAEEIARLTTEDQEKALPNAGEFSTIYDNYVGMAEHDRKNDYKAKHYIPKPLVEFRQWIHSSLTRKLSEMPWDPTDRDLVKAAGACSACPKNSAHNATLFGDIGSDGRCMDQTCFDSKLLAFRTRILDEAKKKHELTFKKIRGLIYGWVYNPGPVPRGTIYSDKLNKDALFTLKDDRMKKCENLQGAVIIHSRDRQGPKVGTVLGYCSKQGEGCKCTEVETNEAGVKTLKSEMGRGRNSAMGIYNGAYSQARQKRTAAFGEYAWEKIKVKKRKSWPAEELEFLYENEILLEGYAHHGSRQHMTARFVFNPEEYQKWSDLEDYAERKQALEEATKTGLATAEQRRLLLLNGHFYTLVSNGYGKEPYYEYLKEFHPKIYEGAIQKADAVFAIYQEELESLKAQALEEGREELPEYLGDRGNQLIQIFDLINGLENGLEDKRLMEILNQLYLRPEDLRSDLRDMSGLVLLDIGWQVDSDYFRTRSLEAIRELAKTYRDGDFPLLGFTPQDAYYWATNKHNPVWIKNPYKLETLPTAQQLFDTFSKEEELDSIGMMALEFIQDEEIQDEMNTTLIEANAGESDEVDYALDLFADIPALSLEYWQQVESALKAHQQQVSKCDIFQI